MRETEAGLRLTLLTTSFSDIALLRTQSLDAVARHLGHEVRVVTTEPGDVLASLAGTPFASRLVRLPAAGVLELARDGTDVLMAVKALPESLGQGHRLARVARVPFLVDVDDPDIEARTVASARSRARRVQKMARGWRTLPGQARLAVLARRTPGTVSNPVLQRRWGGELVPHARPDPGAGAEHTSERPTIAFVGTPKTHKGIHLLREAVARLSGSGWRLLVTAPPPSDARAWETWTGPLDGSIDAMRLTAEADVVAIPSLDYGWARAQLPLKLVDAMLTARAVVVSDVGPLPWAVGDAGRVFRAGSVEGLVGALAPLRDPLVRAGLGGRARELALARYTVEAVAPAFARALDGARRTA